MYSPVLYGICLRYSHDRTEAEDNLHDSFMTIFEKIGQYRSEGSFEGWIKRITINTNLQKFRREEFLNVVSDNIAEETEEIESPPVSLNTLLEFVQELPAKYRKTFNLYVLDGYSHQEISTLMGTSVGTSKSNLARARAILRTKIETKTPRSVVNTLVVESGDKGRSEKEKPS